MKNKVKKLIESLKNVSVDRQTEIVRELGSSGSKKAVRPLINLLNHFLGNFEKRFLVSAVIEALGDLGAREAEEVLLKAIDNPLFFVKVAAAQAMGKIKPGPKVVDKLKKVLLSDTSNEVRKGAIEGLGKTKKEKIIKPLSDVAKKTSDKGVKEEAIQALGKTKKSEAAAPLMDIYYKEADVKLREDIIIALSKIATLGSVGFLIQALTDGNPEIRSCAALALGESRDNLAKYPLNGLITDPVEKVRKSAAKALGLITFLPK